MPNLVLIDGGKGQLDAAIRAMKEQNVAVPVISIAKREEEIIVHSTKSHIDTTMLESLMKNPSPNEYVERSGEYYVVNLHPGQLNASGHSRNLRGAPISNAHADVVKLFQRIRDESHRFAVSYHTVLKRQKQTASDLEEIPGIGPATRKKLIRTFGSLRSVKLATQEQIVDAIGADKAVKLKPYL
jgi:excinuclease ABC subunit C